jgi:thiamine-phosphate diphosphorylase
MVTDRQRWSGRAPRGVAARAALDDLVARVRAAARAGVHVVEIRERDLDGRTLVDLVAACVTAVRDTRTRILVNDRLDVALASGAHGVHLRSTSMAAARIRHLTPPGFLLGRSVHSPDEIAAADREGSVDYVMFGAVWPTVSKPGGRAVGEHALADAVRLTSLPVLAVGGVTEARVAGVARAGAAGIAAIGLFGGSAGAGAGGSASGSVDGEGKNTDMHTDTPAAVDDAELSACVRRILLAWTG